VGIVEVEVRSLRMACWGIGGVEYLGSAPRNHKCVAVFVCKDKQAITSRLAISKFCWCHVLYAVERKIGFVHRISISCLRWRGNFYGNWRPQFVPAPELFTSFQETRVKISKPEQWNCFVFTVARFSTSTCRASEVCSNSCLEPWAREVDGWFICCWKLIFTMRKW